MILDGKTITGANPHYENIGVRLADGTYVFLSPADLTTILSEFIFTAEKKKTRTWITPVTPDVPLLYDQNKYPQ